MFADSFALLLHGVPPLSTSITLSGQNLCRRTHSQRQKSAAALSSGAGVSPKEEEGEFEVTWEHEDGTVDKVVGVHLINRMYPAPGRWRSGSHASDGQNTYEADDWWRTLHPLPAAGPAAGSAAQAGGPLGRLGRAIRGFFGGERVDRARLAALGANALLAYGFVSNISYASCIIASWVIFGKRTGLSPLAPGQWPAFLAVYAGFWSVQNVIRPARFALSVALTPAFDAFVLALQRKASAVTGRPVGKAAALAAAVFVVNVCGTVSFLVGGLVLATRIAGVPLLAAA